MRVLSIVAMVFLPISTISSIFGSSFFTSTFPTQNGELDGHSKSNGFDTNPQITLLWAVAAPVTTAIVGMWLAWENWDWINDRLSRCFLSSCLRGVPEESGDGDIERAN
jgi:hypothetical protein